MGEMIRVQIMNKFAEAYRMAIGPSGPKNHAVNHLTKLNISFKYIMLCNARV